MQADRVTVTVPQGGVTSPTTIEVATPEDPPVTVESGTPEEPSITVEGATPKEPPAETEWGGWDAAVPMGNPVEIIATGGTISRATIELPYDPQQLPEGATEQDLFIVTFDEANQRWVLVGGVVDTEGNTIRAEVEHFSLFGVVAVAANWLADKLEGVLSSVTNDLFAIPPDLKCDPVNPLVLIEATDTLGLPPEACAEQPNRVRLVNQHAYPLLLKMSPGVELAALDLWKEDGLDLIWRAVYEQRGQVILPGAGQLVLQVPLGGDVDEAVITGLLDWPTVAFGLTMMLVSHAVTLGKATAAELALISQLDCFLGSPAAARQNPADWLVNTVRKCLPQMLSDFGPSLVPRLGQAILSSVRVIPAYTEALLAETGTRVFGGDTHVTVTVTRFSCGHVSTQAAGFLDDVGSVHEAACQLNYEAVENLMSPAFTYDPNYAYGAASMVVDSWRRFDPTGGRILVKLAQLLETIPTATQGGLIYEQGEATAIFARGLLSDPRSQGAWTAFWPSEYEHIEFLYRY